MQDTEKINAFFSFGTGEKAVCEENSRGGVRISSGGGRSSLKVSLIELLSFIEKTV